MGRPRKEDKQQKETAELMISVDEFKQTRDSRNNAPSMPASAFLPPAQALQARVGMGDMSRQLRELISSIPLVLAQLRLIPDPKFFIQVVVGLTTLQAAVQDLLNSYIKHTHSVLGTTPHRLDGISNPLNNNDILAGTGLRGSPPATAGPATAAAPQPVAAPVVAPAEEEPVKKGRKPKKEKKEKDPNEPKRPLTMYFLYSAQARPIVKEDLGPNVSPGAVEEEIKKRWRELGEDEKKAWQEVYTKNRDEYLVKIAEYKAAKSEAEAGKSPAAGADADVEMAEGAATAAGADEATPSEEESEKEPSPAKAPTPPAESKTPKPKRRKTGKENGVAAASSAAAPAHTASPIPLPSHPKNAVESTPAKAKAEKKGKKEEPKEAPKEVVEEPKKRRGRKSKGAEEVAAAAAETAAAEPEKKNKRKRKSEAAAA
ncbi:hypothetical protein DIS24_g6432 [Lasiodiplodia hormozganensis]|uniref:HMG box domain-containing protein n=1 Tax=Lasiodiplodia hormozganensis TaxID=869390 RepID=A0AA39YDW8_9PEZI|nr:hypothetical protein DIS24_g6432 [Lasiodiplodia hormozganensis]